MSHRHVLLPKAVPVRRPWLEATVILGVAFLIALYAFYRSGDRPSEYEYSTTMGTVLDTRIVVDSMRESRYGGLIYYRIEADVSFEIQGRQQERWLTASETTTARELLMARLSNKPKACRVYWRPDHPENARCEFQIPSPPGQSTQAGRTGCGKGRETVG
jgi:hypothetical protein